MTDPAKCHCGSISWERKIEENRYICASCKRPLWQPIETAPKDGETILIYGAFYDDVALRDVRFAYWEEVTQAWEIEGEEIIATHWMPLPEGPRE